MEIKKILKLIWDEFIYSGHLLSLGAVSVVLTSAVLLKIKITLEFLIVVYLWTQSVYLYNRFKELGGDFLTNPKRVEHFKKYIKYAPLIIAISVFLGATILIYFNKSSAIFFGFLLFLLSVLYSLFLKKITRRVMMFKSFFVSLIWALMIVFLALYYKFPFDFSLLLICIFVYLRLFIHEEFLNIKDRGSDIKDNLLTLIIVWGKRKTLSVLNIINFLTIIPIIYGIYFNFLPVYSLMILLVIPYAFCYLKKAADKKINQSFLYNIVADGEYVLWPFFVLIGKIIVK